MKPAVALTRGALAAAASVALGACATAPWPAPPADVAYRAAPRTTLAVSDRDARFLVAHWQRDGLGTTVLARERLREGAGDVAPPQPVARLVQVGQGAAAQIALQTLPGRGRPDAATLERLYPLVLRQEPLARYCLAGRWDRAAADAAPAQAAALPCDPRHAGLSQAQVLQVLAQARETARTQVREPAATRGADAPPWRVLEIAAPAPRFWDADHVVVRATVGQAPLEGLPIYFNRAPHSMCVARTGADGTASCRLIDPHGDEEQHDHAAAVVATFGGDVRADRVILPTTHVLPVPLRPRLSGAAPLPR